jgi:hypothetical protein
MILQDAMAKFSRRERKFMAHQEFHHGMNAVSLQKEFSVINVPAKRKIV